MNFSAENIVEACNAKIFKKGASLIGRGVSTDSRTAKASDLFFALKGPNFDGHAFIDQAVSNGAWGLIIENEVGCSLPLDVWGFKVEKSLEALGNLANWWRSEFSIPCVAITGSNGKTTTKEVVAAILSIKYQVLKTQGNFNNLIGLPLTLFKLNKNHQMIVLELGMNEPGEIEKLAQISAPKVGLITSIAPAHLEKMKSVEKIAKAKWALFDALPKNGVAAVNLDDPYLAKLSKGYNGKMITFGESENADVELKSFRMNGFEKMDLEFSIYDEEFKGSINLSGRHHARNVMGAIAAAIALGCTPNEILAGLAAFKQMKMRFEVVSRGGVTLINDAYNANPSSVKAALQTVSQMNLNRRFVAILGDMKELGDKSDYWHEQIGGVVHQTKVNLLCTVGELAKSIGKGAIDVGFNKSDVYHFESNEALLTFLEPEMKKEDVVLVKGSRSMQMEEIVNALEKRLEC